MPTDQHKLCTHIFPKGVAQTYDRYVLAAITGGCDQWQAECIARERILGDIAREEAKFTATVRR